MKGAGQRGLDIMSPIRALWYLWWCMLLDLVTAVQLCPVGLVRQDARWAGKHVCGRHAVPPAG